MTKLRIMWVLFRKEFLVEARSREMLSTMGLFAILLVVLFSFAFYTDSERANIYAPGILWTTVLFAGTLGLNRLFDKETEAHAFDALVLSGASPRLVFFVKAMTHFILTMAVVLITLPALVLFFRLELDAPGFLLLTMAVGTLGFSFVGTLFASLLANARMRDVLLPLVIYPIAVPVLVAGVKTAGGILQGGPVSEVYSWVQFMLGYDLLFVSATTWIFDRLSRS